MTKAEGLAYVLAHPTRQRIIALLKGGEEMSIREIEERLKEPRELIGFHLVALEQHALVSRVMKFANSDPRVEAKFKQTEKVKEAVEVLRTLV